MNVSEAAAVNELLRYLIGHPIDGRSVPDPQEARQEAEFLATRAHKTLSAGLTAESVRRMWPADPDQAMAPEVLAVAFETSGGACDHSEPACLDCAAGSVDHPRTMIKARGRIGSRPILLLGLSGENVTRLAAGEPIVFDADDLGYPGRVVLMCGRTEPELLEQLHTLGLVDEQTKGRIG